MIQQILQLDDTPVRTGGRRFFGYPSRGAAFMKPVTVHTAVVSMYVNTLALPSVSRMPCLWNNSNFRFCLSKPSHLTPVPIRFDDTGARKRREHEPETIACEKELQAYRIGVDGVCRRYGYCVLCREFFDFFFVFSLSFFSVFLYFILFSSNHSSSGYSSPEFTLLRGRLCRFCHVINPFPRDK